MVPCVAWKNVKWEMDSKEVINTFSEDARENLGNDLRRVQAGEKPLDFRPMKTVGPGVFELRDQDKDFWYRVFYTQTKAMIHVLHCFRKKSNKPSQNDIETGRQRLKALNQRLARER